MRRKTKPWVWMGVLGCMASTAFGRTLSLDEYLQEVKQGNPTLHAAAATIESTQLRAQNTDLMFTPQFFSQLTRSLDAKPQANPLAGKKTESLALSFGVQKLWSFGLQSQVTYQVADIDVDREPLGLPPLAPGVDNPLNAFGKDLAYKEAQTRFDLIQPLWKNRAGRDYTSTETLLQTRLSQQKLGESFKVRSLLAQAEAVYWQLALAQEAVRMQEDTLQRFERIRDWIGGRVRMSLADRADLLQAEAGVKARRIELQLAIVDRTSKQRTLNAMRAVPGEGFDRDLQPLSTRVLNETISAKGAVKRLDVEIAKQSEKVAAIEIEQQRERYTPQLDVFGTVALNSDQKEDWGDAATGAFSSQRPTLVVGLKFSTPLDQDVIKRERQGLVKASDATRFDREQKELTAQQEWDELQRQLIDAKARLQLATELEAAQKSKLDYEKERHQRGRSTTYQILLFEQDYANAQLMVIRAKAEILTIASRLKTFGDAV